jgi:hypothetical protein
MSQTIHNMVSWPTTIDNLQRSPNYEGPASPLENDENWDLPAGESESQKSHDEDESEYIIPLMPNVSQNPPDDF